MSEQKLTLLPKNTTSLTDNYRHKGARRKLVNILMEKGIHDQDVLTAIRMLPRHFFIPKDFETQAYLDKAIPIGKEQTISQPLTVAIQTQLLEVKKRDKILEIGTGSGYQAAILGLLNARVYTIERQKVLYQSAKNLLSKLPVGNIRCYYKDGYLGLPEFAPFDKIIVTAGATSIPRELLDQLRIGGYMIIPVGKSSQKMKRIIKKSDSEFIEEDHGNFRFVPFLRGLNND